VRNQTLDRGKLLFVFVLGGVLAPPAARAAQLKSVQTGTATISGGSPTATGTLSPAVDTTKAFLVFGVTLNSGSPNDGQVSGQITNGTTVTFQRIGTTGVITVKWYVVKFLSGVTVQRGSAQLPDLPNPADVDVTIAAVNLSKSFPLISYRTNGGTYDGGYFASLAA
jgi:hypothetical protein